MKATYRLNKRLNYLDIKVSGKATKKELMKLIEEMYTSDWYRPDANEIWDLSECKDELFFCSELLEIAQLEQNVRYVEKGVKSAGVVSDPCTRQSLRDYLLLAKEVGYEYEIFESYEEAFDWIMAKEEDS